MDAFINTAVFETNQGYQASGIKINVELAGISYVGNSEDFLPDGKTENDSGEILYHLSWYETPEHHELEDLRDDLEADAVIIVADYRKCGDAYLPLEENLSVKMAWSVVNWSCATGYYSFGHELNHNL